MSRDLYYNHKWLQANGKKVTVAGKEYIIRVEAHKAIYPYEHYVISVTADPVDKSDEEYLHIKRMLGDDWATDVLEAGEAFYASVYEQCFGKEEINYV